MRRRNVLQVGAALATLPLAGCSQGHPPPSHPQPMAPSGRPVAEPGAASSGAPPPTRDGDSPPQAEPSPTPDAAKPQAPVTAAEPSKGDMARVIARVGKNHGHVFTVALADVLAGAEKTYELPGASHPHSVTLSAEHMATLRKTEILRTRSTENSGHSHRLWVRCAPAVDPPEWVSACKAEFTGRDEHELVIPVADLASTAERTYDVQGIAGHAHQLTITPADFEQLRKGGPVTRHTSRLAEDAHMHQVTIEVLKRKG